MIQTQSSEGNAKSFRCTETLVTGHAIDQFLERAPNPPNGEGRDFHKQVARQIAAAVRKAKFVMNRKEGKLFVHEGMGYVLIVFPHYRKVVTCYRVDMDSNRRGQEIRCNCG